MRRLYPHLAISSLALLVAAAGVVWPRASARQTERLPSPEPRTLGVAGCAAMACHHGNGSPGRKGSEYSTWVAVDPHAKAYQTLFKEESRRMQANLAAHSDVYKKFGAAHENKLCLKCHGMGGD